MKSKKIVVNLQPGHENRHEKAKSVFKSQSFNDMCLNAGIEPTKRQSRKWCNKKGAAYKVAHKIEMNGFVIPAI